MPRVLQFHDPIEADHSTAVVALLPPNFFRDKSPEIGWNGLTCFKEELGASSHWWRLTIENKMWWDELSFAILNLKELLGDGMKELWACILILVVKQDEVNLFSFLAGASKYLVDECHFLKCETLNWGMVHLPWCTPPMHVLGCIWRFVHDGPQSRHRLDKNNKLYYSQRMLPKSIGWRFPGKCEQYNMFKHSMNSNKQRIPRPPGSWTIPINMPRQKTIKWGQTTK